MNTLPITLIEPDPAPISIEEIDEALGGAANTGSIAAPQRPMLFTPEQLALLIVTERAAERQKVYDELGFKAVAVPR